MIVQHPETVGSGPQLFQTFTVHRSPVTKIMLSEKHLVSGSRLFCAQICIGGSPLFLSNEIFVCIALICIIPTCDRKELDRFGGGGWLGSSFLK